MANVFINDDFCGIWLNDPAEMTVEGLKKQIDFYTEQPGAEAILFNMNAMSAYFNSKTWESVWHDCTEEDEEGRVFYRGREVVDYKPEPPMKTMVCNARRMAKNVPDIFEVRYQYCHEKGVEMWHSMRMNDAHWVPDPELPQHTEFWREHPEFRRAAYRVPLSSIWSDQALDFLHEEVRERAFALIAEYLEHECDGIELDFLRTTPLFAPGGSDEGMPLLTDMMRRIRKEADKAAEKFGHRVRIMVRVCPDPETNLASGMDVFTWAEEGLCDIVAPCPMQPYGNRLDIPVAIWKKLLPANIVLAPGIDIGISSGYPGGRMKTNKETDAGFAATYYYRGADAVYFYNHFYAGSSYHKRDEQKITFGFIGDRAKTEARVRRHVATFREGGLPGVSDTKPFFPLCWKGSGIYNEIDAGGGTAGRTGYVLIGSNTEITDGEILLNRIKCERVDVPADWELPALPHFAFFKAPEGALHDGYNGIDVINRSLEADFELRWVELDVI